ncbi:porin family protein [Pseudopedobacter sp.]|uniref:porin family protein n=1 Tax=Pseudopedobacter sp. TaxID=1936787 RepID=UPI0033417E7C
MKKLLTIALVFLFANNLKAQYREGSDFKLGLTAHPTLGWIRSDINAVKSDGLRMGFSYGVLGDFLFRDTYAFSTALKLTTINGKTEQTEGATVTQSVYKLQYIEIPAKLKLLTGEDKSIRFYGEFGLGNTFNVRAKGDVKSNDATIAAEDSDIYKNISFYRGSIIIGGGAEISTSGKTRLLAGLTFDNGFTDIQKGAGTLKNSYLGINLGVFF